MDAELDPRTKNKFIVLQEDRISSVKAIENIKNKLSPSQQERFKASCFGKLVDMPPIRFSGQLVLHLLSRLSDHPAEELWFDIEGKSARFSQNEFALVTGLNCGQYPSAADLKEMTRKTKLKDRYFDSKKSLLTKCLEQKFLSCVDKEDTFRLSLVYFLEAVLFTRGRNSPIDQKWLSLVDDLDAFYKFPWGKKCYEITLLSLKRAIADLELDLKKTGVEGCKTHYYRLCGFPLAFQVWIYEVIPILGCKYAKRNERADRIPRILSWKYARTRKYNGISENLNVLKTLEATELESQQDYMTTITEFTCEPNEKDEHSEINDSDFDEATQSGYDTDVDEPKRNGYHDTEVDEEIQKSANSAETAAKPHDQQESQVDASGVSSITSTGTSWKCQSSYEDAEEKNDNNTD